MKARVRKVLLQFSRVISENPVEVALSTLFCLFGWVHTFTDTPSVELALPYFPVFLWLTYTVNQLTVGKRIRYLYYLSGLLFIPLIIYDGRFDYQTWLISVVEVILLYLISRRKLDNKNFMEEALRFVGACVVAISLAFVVFLLGISIYFSMSHIFNIWRSLESEAVSVISYFSMFLVAPLIFIYFMKKPLERRYSKWFDILVNYILTPALLIYTVLLYVYFAKILVSWSLPEGGVALIVIFFATGMYIVKELQYFVSTKHFEWFYSRPGWAVLPALLMFWVGVAYRIREYGLTESRVYLLIIGIVLTATALLFFSKKYGRFMYTASLTAILFFVVTYIPGITAEDLGYYSQNYREKNGLTKKREINAYSRDLYISYYGPIDAKGINTIYPIRYSNEDSTYWSRTTTSEIGDSLYLYDGNNNLVWSENVNTLLENQIKKIGITNYREIPDSVYPDLLRVEMDSAALVFESVYLVNKSRNRDSLVVSYWTPTYYLK